ncbi:AMP-binding protein [Bacillus horti]|uniref:acetate--CoA ligase n=1 Tax=Caldalkalibacillus horti TaxID=77523 RepID=A0ABT9W2G4_9BACI|nr:AMP-binding protein [Bacillus horti]MDQ0167443.1 acetyl-CoA synthetase [Bacillus horti]
METKAVWFPTENSMKQTRMYNWMKKLGVSDYEELYNRSVHEPDWFWSEVEKEIELGWYEPYTEIMNTQHGAPWVRWFEEGKTNVCLNALEKWRNHAQVWHKPAIILLNELGERIELTYAELSELVNRAAFGLRSMGLGKGDVVLLYMPMIPETLITMLACSKLGAIFTPIFSGFAVDGIQKRIEAAEPKMIVTADTFTRKGKSIKMKAVVDEALDHLQSNSTVERVIVVSKKSSEDMESKHEGLREMSWHELINAGALDATEQMDSQDPFMLIYTSGTTSRPKGIVHTHTGFPLKAAFDAGICMDLKQEDKMLWVTDMGWMMGPFLVYGVLLNGSTMVFYDGSPDYPTNTALFKHVAEERISHLGISPTLIRSMMSKVTKDDLEQLDLVSLKVFCSTGEPWNPEPWLWLFEAVGHKKIPIFNYSGGTEISGGIFGNVLVKPIAPTGFNSALPGMAAAIYQADGTEMKEPEEVGELVLKAPWVGMANGFWLEPERYEQTYWSRWENIWLHGDWVHQDTEGHWYITGRSDDTLNIAGKRMGPAEMESILIEHPKVKEAGTIGVPDEIKGETAVCFVVLQEEQANKEQIDGLQVELFQLVQKRLGKALSPKSIHIVSDLPKTRNAKIMRRVIRSAYLGLDTGDISALENPETIAQIQSCHPAQRLNE